MIQVKFCTKKYNSCLFVGLFLLFSFNIQTLLVAQTFDEKNKTESAEIEKSQEEEKSEAQKRRDTINYGLDSEVSELIETLIKDDDNGYTDSLIDLFKVSSNRDVREKIITYCSHFKIPDLKDYALTLLEDPYDENKETVSLVCNYVKTLKINEAAPALQAMLETENKTYYYMAISALAVVGGPEQAVFLSKMFDDDDLDINVRQELVKALGELKAVETWDKLKDLAEDENENLYVRMYAAEAIGEMKKPESIDVLINLFDSSDPSIREYVLKGLSNYTDKKVQNLIVSAVKDNYWKVRKQAILIVKDQKIEAAAPYLRYRAQNDSESVIVYEAMESLAVLNDKEGVDFLIKTVKDTKKNDVLRSKSAEALLKNNINRGYDAVIEAASETLENDHLKKLRYALGKLFAKYPNSAWRDICEKYLYNKDVATKGTGLDIYNKNRYLTLTSMVKLMAENDESTAIKNKAKLILEKD